MLNYRIKLLIFVFMLSTRFQCSFSIIRPRNAISVVEGEGFLAYLEVSEDFGAITQCKFTFRDDEPVLIDLKAQKPLSTKRGEQILPFSADICGIKVQNVTLASAATWKLEATSRKATSIDSIKLIVMTAPRRRFETHLQTDNGQGYIGCKRSDANLCKIIDNEGVVWSTCSMNPILRAGMTFQCLIYNSGRLESSHEYIIVESKEPVLTSNATQVEDEQSVTLRCQAQKRMRSCLAYHTGKVNGFLITEGLYNGRYSAHDTLSSKGLCALNIPKPLRDDEVGVWRMIDSADSSSSAGCLFYVGGEQQAIIEKELATLKKMQEYKVYNTAKYIAELSVIVPFRIVDCYLRDPNNTLYYPDDNRFEHTRLYGKCAIKNLPVVNGIWEFGVRGPDYDKEVTQLINVQVKSPVGEVLTKWVHGRTHGSVELMCRSPFEEPLDKCAYIDPQNKVHLVATEDSTNARGRVHYYGRGLEVGECGIKVTDIDDTDFGEWECQYVILGSNRVTASFKVRLEDVGQAGSIGLIVGISVVVIIFGTFALVTLYYRRRNIRAQHTFADNDPYELRQSTGTVESHT